MVLHAGIRDLKRGESVGLILKSSCVLSIIFKTKSRKLSSNALYCRTEFGYLKTVNVLQVNWSPAYCFQSSSAKSSKF